VRARLLRRAGVVAGLAALLVGAAAAPAAAHAVGTGTEASNYRTTVRGIEQGVPGLSVRALAGGLLELTNRTGQEVVVLGYRLEPYLRVGPDGVFENQRSPSTYTNRFRTAPGSIPPEFDPKAAPEWKRIGDGPSVGWHDHRAHWTGPAPPAVKASPKTVQAVREWEVPLRQGDHDMLIRGDITWVPGPSPWPWVLLVLAAGAAVVAAGRSGHPGLLALAALAAVAADMTHTAGSFAASTASVATMPAPRPKLAAMAALVGSGPSADGSCERARAPRSGRAPAAATNTPASSR